MPRSYPLRKVVVGTEKNLELFQRRDPGTPPNLDEEFDDEEGSKESSMIPIESSIMPNVSANQPSAIKTRPKIKKRSSSFLANLFFCLFFFDDVSAFALQ